VGGVVGGVVSVGLAALWYKTIKKGSNNKLSEKEMIQKRDDEKEKYEKQKVIDEQIYQRDQQQQKNEMISDQV